MLLTVASLGGALVVTSLAATPTSAGTQTMPTKRSSVAAGTSSGARSVAKTPAQKAQERKIVGTLRQMGFKVTGITRTANGQYSVQVNRFNPASATGAFRGVVSFRQSAAQTGRAMGPTHLNQRGNAANMPEQIGSDEIGGPSGGTAGGGNAGAGDTDSIGTPGGATAGGPTGGGMDGGTGPGRGTDGIGGGLGDDGFGDGGGLGPDGGGLGPDGGTGGGNTGPGSDGQGPDRGGTAPDGGGIGPDGGDGGGDEGGPGGGTVGPGEEGPPSPSDDGGGNDPDGGTGPDDGGDTGGGGEEGPPSDPDDGDSGRIAGRGASRDLSRTSNQAAGRAGMLAAGGVATLQVSVSSRGVLSISRRSLAQAGLINHAPSAANGNVIFH